jgi:hypothetical protein
MKVTFIAMTYSVFISAKKAVHKISATALNKSKKRKRFFSFRFKTTSHRLRYIGHISGARCDLDGR